MSKNYTGKHIKDLKATMRLAFEEGLHSNDCFRKRYFTVPKSSKKKTPLTLQEVRALELLEVNGNHSRQLALAKDVFLLGCYLGLRVSDIKRINRWALQDGKNGVQLHITTQKTSTRIKVPVSSAALEILRRYDFHLPTFNEQVVNRHLKVIGSEIGLTTERAQRLTIHVSRHTFAKLSYEMGIASMSIMSITGHSNERNFLRYIDIQPDLAVEEFRKHEYFR